MVSMNEGSCHWSGEVPVGRVKGRTIKWVSKVEVVSNSVFNGNWGFGTTDMFLDRSHMMHQKYRTCARLYFEGQVPE
jgi:hypothetical protein